VTERTLPAETKAEILPCFSRKVAVTAFYDLAPLRNGCPHCEIQHLRRCLKEADERYRRKHAHLMYADILCTLAGDLTSGREGDDV
jgi:gluconate kinase